MKTYTVQAQNLPGMPDSEDYAQHGFSGILLYSLIFVIIIFIVVFYKLVIGYSKEFREDKNMLAELYKGNQDVIKENTEINAGVKTSLDLLRESNTEQIESLKQVINQNK